LFGRIDDSVKVELLTLISHIDHPVCVFLIGPVTNGREVSCVITIAAIALLHHERHLTLGDEDALGAIGFCQLAPSGEVLKHRLDQWVVERLAAVDDADLQSVVDALELFLRNAAEHLPCLISAGITLLQLDYVLMRDLLKVLLSVESLLGALVEHHQISDGGRVVEEVGELIVQTGNQHAELGAPVAQVIHASDVVANELKDAADCVSNNG
jgi:hypothetical protein